MARPSPTPTVERYLDLAHAGVDQGFHNEEKLMTSKRPIVGHIYIGGKDINPSWLQRRRVIVSHVGTHGDSTPLHIQVRARVRRAIETIDIIVWDAYPDPAMALRMSCSTTALAAVSAPS